MHPRSMQFVALGALLWIAFFWLYPHPMIIYRLPSLGLLACCIGTFVFTGYFPRWLLVAGCVCAGASVALGLVALLFGMGGHLLTLLFGGLWAWYFTWGPGQRYWWMS